MDCSLVAEFWAQERRPFGAPFEAQGKPFATQGKQGKQAAALQGLLGSH
jgi:hypothetical protein